MYNRDDWPDIQLQFIAGSSISDDGTNIRKNDGIKDSV
jgi:hypothetical protein